MDTNTTQFSSGSNPNFQPGNTPQAPAPMPEQGKINTENAESESKPRGFSFIISIAIALTLIFVIIAVVLYITTRAKQAKLNKTNQEITQVNSQIDAKPDLEKAITAIYGQVNNLDDVLAKRTFWSNFLNEISNKNTLKNQYLSVNAQDLNKIQISGRASDLVAVAYITKSFQNSKFFSNVTLTNANKETIGTTAQPSVVFNLQMSMSQTLLSNQSNANRSQTTTGSTNAETPATTPTSQGD